MTAASIPASLEHSRLRGRYVSAHKRALIALASVGIVAAAVGVKAANAQYGSPPSPSYTPPPALLQPMLRLHAIPVAPTVDLPVKPTAPGPSTPLAPVRRPCQPKLWPVGVARGARSDA